MNRFSLKWKIALVGVLPLLCFLSLIIYGIYINYNSLKEAQSLADKVGVVGALSSVVHEAQKERGQTAAFLSGGIELSRLEEQKMIVDEKINLFTDSLKISSFSKDYKTEILGEMDKLSQVRKQVSVKAVPMSVAIGKYSAVIKRFLAVEVDVANETELAKISTKLRAFRILEESKESGGKLRASMAAILGKDQPINEKQFNTLVTLKAGVDEGVRSYGLVLDKESKNFINTFNSSNEWATVGQVFQKILMKAEVGKYGYGSKEFFSTITVALNILGGLIDHQKGVLLSDIQSIEDSAYSNLWKILTSALILFSAVFALMFFISNTTSKNILNVAFKIIEGAKEVSRSSEIMASTSAQLSESATEQASSLQETASSVDEISSMIQRNADSANSSTEMSSLSTEAASSGKSKIDAMIMSIKDISDSNDEIRQEVESNNHNLTKIVEVISEIGEKTKVINDIVFQTKLLSFNASVEAARAGEHGKGFAVVAEEVGNLASMSGKAALEISEMLDASIKQVKDIVETSKRKMEGLINAGKEKVESGTITAVECGNSLDEILKNVSSVNEMVKEIANASAEQSNGVQEITVAMQQLDQVSHQNTSAANESSSTAKQLKEQAEWLNQAVTALMLIVNGSRSNNFNNEHNNDHYNMPKGGKVLSMEKKVYSTNSQKSTQRGEGLKVSGLDAVIPSENDSRFEDL